MGEDKRLERIYDYTKWHMGIYFSAAGALTAGIGYLAERKEPQAPLPLIDHPWILLLAIVFMLLAGVCGAMVASSCTECNTYEELWDGKHGPYSLKLYPGRIWARCEHSFFWLGVLSLISCILCTKAVWAWLLYSDKLVAVIHH